MKRKLTSLLIVLIVLFGFIGCPDPDNDDNKDKDTTPTSPAMQVYNSDKTTPYTGEDLDFYIQGDTSKTLAATIRNGKLVIRYIPLPEDCEFGAINGATSQSPSDLQCFNITLTTFDGTKKVSYLGNPTGRMAIWYFNNDGSWVISNTTIYVTKGWNFYIYPISLADPTNDRDGKFKWVVENN